MDINDGGNAFPIPGLHHDADFNGMTLRDYFAAKALIGWRKSEGTTYEQDAKAAYEMADAMLKARQGASNG